jgi:hypothetical protein
MTQTTLTRRAFLLVELMAVLAIGALLLGVLGKMVVDMIYLQRIATQHADRVAMMDALTRRIRTDTLASVNYEWREHALVLRTLGSAGLTTVTYRFDPATIERQATGEAPTAWRSRRLEFAQRIERGPRGDVLTLDFIESPPPRATSLPNRKFPVAFLLPPVAGDAADLDPGSTP